MSKTSEYLLKQRIKSGLLQKELAKKLKVSPQYVGSVEKGTSPVPIKILKKWNDEIGASYSKVLCCLVDDYKEKVKEHL